MENIDPENIIERLNAMEQEPHVEPQEELQKAIKFGDLKTNKWYKVIKKSQMLEGDYGKYFVMTLERFESVKSNGKYGEIIKVFSTRRLIPKYKRLIGKYLKYNGISEKEYGSGGYSHDYILVSLKRLNSLYPKPKTRQDK